MIIYSVEIQIQKTVSKQWVNWMQAKHIPDVMNTKLFVDFHFFKNLNSENNYTIQYELDNMEKFLEYDIYFAKKLQEEHHEKFKNKFKAKRTILVKKNID